MPGARSFVPKTRAGGFAWVLAAYLAGGVAAWYVAQIFAGAALWQRVLYADLAATIVVFAFSFILDNSSVYDPYWSVAPIPVAVALALLPGAPMARRWLVAVFVIAWGLRLTWNWARGWTGLHHEDWRYVDLRNKTGGGYWLVSLLGLHTMPTITVYLGMLALLPALSTGRQPLNIVDWLAAAVTGGAILIEALADEQLREFRRRGGSGEILATGLWAWSRHPNYLGEVMFWWGVWLFGVAAQPSAYWWTLPGPLWVTALFVFISVPMLDRRSLLRRPAYAEHMRRVPGLLPRPWRRPWRRP